eukprot:CCRYP_005419-RA/>CCRYP_005419-RA protein AED:0.43 eAED:0.43 QI:0/0/0/1/0/0/2/0/159
MTPRPRVSAPILPAYNSAVGTAYNHTGNHPTPAPQHRTPLTPRRAATRQFPREALSAILDTDTGELLGIATSSKPKYSTIWKNAYGKELGRLAQGIPALGVTYGRIVANYRPKGDPYRIRLTVGGNRITYPGDCGTPTADMLTTKILLNSVISTKEHGS